MPALGYALSSEEHPPERLAENAARAEAVGFEFASISDHYHPWVSEQGNSPFVWGTLGAIAERTDDIEIGTGVTAPIKRIHPAIVAQAAATAAVQLEDRFYLGVGTGEALNEHVVGGRWPPFDVRMEMLEEAVEVIRGLWEGEEFSHHGEHYTVENARLFTTPDDPPPIHVGASGDKSAEAAARIGDGLVATTDDEDLVEYFDDDQPKFGQATVCYAESESEAVERAHEVWPNGAIRGELSQVLPSPAHFEQAAEMVDEEDVAEAMVCSADADDHIEEIQDYVDAGYDHVYVHQVGEPQEPFFEFYESEVLPSFA